MDSIFNSNFDTLKTALDVQLKRQELHAENIANAETPGYKKSTLHSKNIFNNPR